MRAAVLTQFNQPWELKELPEPKPGPGQIVIKIHASGMCGTDMHAHHGVLGAQVPIVCGHEPAGEIVALGAGVTHLRVGDRVGIPWVQSSCGRCRMCQSGKKNYCPESKSWMHIGGGNQQLMLAWAENATLLPDGLSYENAAPIFCAGYTVMSGLRNASPKPGERVAVLGMGGLGHLALQFSKALGLETIAVTGTQNKLKESRDMGADDAIVAGDHAGKALQAIGGVDVILSTSNSMQQVAQALVGLRPEGRLVNMGVGMGNIEVNPMDFLFGQKRLIGSSQDERSDLVEALELTAKGKVKPMLEVYPLEKVNEVVARLDAGKVRYRAVLTLN